MMSFLFVWQTMIQAPLVIASAAIGFAKYFFLPGTAYTFYRKNRQRCSGGINNYFIVS
jgi:hypothetical protein